MDQLEFALIPVGIVFGFGISRVLQAWAGVIRMPHRERGNPFLFVSATAMGLVIMYLNFSGLWAYGEVNFSLNSGIFNAAFLLILTLPMLLFMLAVLVLTHDSIEASTDLNAHYRATSRRFFLIFCLALGASFLPDLLPGVKATPNPIYGLLVIGLFAVLALVRNATAHLVMHVIFWACIVFILALSLAGISGGD